MVDLLRPLRINALELLRQPGSTRDVVGEFPAEPLGVVHERLNGEIEIELVLQSTNDAIVVTGTTLVPWRAACRRCLKAIHNRAAVEVDEIFQIEVTNPDAFAIENNQLDLAPMLRDIALLELDAEQVCTDKCAGLCPVCGVDFNAAACDCDNTVVDHRWAALDGLVLDD